MDVDLNERDEFPLLTTIGNLHTFQRSLKTKLETRKHLVGWRREDTQTLCGLEVRGGVGGGSRGVSSFARATCPTCRNAAMAMLDNPDYWAEQKRLNSAAGTLNYLGNRLRSLSRRTT